MPFAFHTVHEDNFRAGRGGSAIPSNVHPVPSIEMLSILVHDFVQAEGLRKLQDLEVVGC